MSLQLLKPFALVLSVTAGVTLVVTAYVRTLQVPALAPAPAVHEAPADVQVLDCDPQDDAWLVPCAEAPGRKVTLQRAG